MKLRSEVQPVLRVLANQVYGLDVYQRGYVWADQEIGAFLADLEDYAAEWSADPAASPWFLGAMIVERRPDRAFIVDGQQRLVTLSLFLLAAFRRAGRGQRGPIQLALGGEGRDLAMPIDVDRYRQVFNALAQEEDFPPDPSWDADQARIAAAHYRMRDWLNRMGGEGELSGLVDGVLRRTLVDVLTVRDTEQAYRMFAGLNARGRPLSTVEALKSVLLIRVPDAEKRRFAEDWDRARIDAETRGGAASANPTLEGLKAALIARYAPEDALPAGMGGKELKTIRTNPFEWLTQDSAWRPSATRIAEELPFFFRLYGRLAGLAGAPTQGAEALHFLGEAGPPIAAWAPLVMAPLDPRAADPAENASKAAAVIAFLDIAAARMAWRPGWMTPAQARDGLIRLIPQLRGCNVEELAYRLVSALHESFGRKLETHAKLRIGPGGLSPRAARALLGRLTAYVEAYASRPVGDYGVFMAQTGRRFDPAPLVPASEEAAAGVPVDEELLQRRDRLGALVLAESSLAQALAGRSPEERLALLDRAGNALAALASTAPQKDARVLAGLGETARRLAPPALGMSADWIAARQEGYAALGERVWSPNRILEAAADPHPRLVAALGLERR